MTQETERAKFEACMRQASRHKPELLSWKDRRYELDAMQSAFCGFCLGMEAALEAKQAEVKMPEPVAKIEGGSLKWHIPNDSYSVKITLLQGTQYLYTEQQLRALLAQHGIKISE